MIKFVAWLSGLWQIVTMGYVGFTGTLPAWCRWSFVVFVGLVVLWWSISRMEKE